MASDDDIAAFLPTPPQPAPAKRAAAIDAAMRRFDGVEDAPRAAPGRPGAARPPFWSVPRRGFAAAMLATFLVAIVGGPIAWNSMRERAQMGGVSPQAAPAAPPAAESGAIADVGAPPPPASAAPAAQPASPPAPVAADAPSRR